MQATEDRQIDSLVNVEGILLASHVGHEALQVWLLDSFYENRNRYLSPVSYSGVCLSLRNVWFTLMKLVSSSGDCAKSSFHRLWVCITITDIRIIQENFLCILTRQLSR